MYARSILLVASVLQDVLASFLRVESGHQRILIDGRDPYVGFFTQIEFSELTCVSAVAIHCLKPLTGAEEIDILYSECERDHWKVAHYTNTKEVYTLGKEVFARRLSIASPLELSIIDVQVESCGSSNSTIAENDCRPSRIHPRRHGKQKSVIRAKDYERRRRKRSIEYVLPAVYRTDASPYEIPIDVVIPHDRTILVQPGVVLRFGDDVGLTIYGVLIVNGTESAPVMFEPHGERWRGLEFINAVQPSQLRYANVSGSTLGITVRSGLPPELDNVISTSNQYGFDIKTTSDVRIISSSALNSEKTGFRITTKGDIWFDTCLSLANREHGFRLESNGSITIVDSHAFSNGVHAVLFVGSPLSISIQNTLVSSSGKNGIRLEISPDKFTTVKIQGVNLTGHYYSAAIEVEDATDVDLEISCCLITDNFNGGISLDGITGNSTISILGSNFTRNRGSIVSIPLIQDSDVILHGNSFTANQLNNFNEHEAVVDIATFAEAPGSKIRVEDNEFEQNTMNNVLELRHLGGRAVMVLISKNNFVANLARSVVDLDMPGGEITGNYFSNVQSSCEISRATPVHMDAVENYWGHDNEADFLPRLCALNRTMNYEVIEAEDMESAHGTTAKTTTTVAVQNTVDGSDTVLQPIMPARTESGSIGGVVVPPVAPDARIDSSSVEGDEQPKSSPDSINTGKGKVLETESDSSSVDGTEEPSKPSLQPPDSINNGKEKVLETESDSSSVDGTEEPSKPSLQPFENTYNQIKAISEPYSINSEVAVYPGQIVIVEPGTQFEFAPGIGITVQERGKLYLNGTPTEPIRLFGKSTWRGIVIKPGGTLVLSNTAIEGASIGLWIDSDKVAVENATILDSVVHGVEITANSGPDVDLGNTEILHAKGSGIGVDERKTSIAISNVAIRDGWGSGIDFLSPTHDVSLENVLVSNGSSYAIHIVEFPAAPLKSVKVRNVTVIDQHRGHAGVLVTSGWAEEVSVDGSTFKGNTVPSLIVAIECHDQPSETRLTNSTFADNEEIVVQFDVGECGALEIAHNQFIDNNKSGKEGVMLVNAEPREGSSALPITIEENEFVRNGGEFSAMLNMQGSNAANGSFRANRLHDNVNSMASVVLTSPYYALESNDFSNTKSAHELEVRSDGTWKVQAIDNKWGTDDLKKAFKGPLSSLPNGIITPEKTLVRANPSPIIPEKTDYSACAHLNYCSRRGKCEGGVCVCPVNYLGLDCSIATGCTSNCSNNGVCEVNKCVCYDGWTSNDCSVPVCRYDCHGHGKCVSRNECECDEGWTGQFCDAPGCRNDTCVHGTCASSNCQCESGWRGSRCSIPLCKNCSINGQCIAPDTCQCFEGYEGEDCSLCRGPLCHTCDFDCVHGVCERETRTCSCARGWSGAACDVCRSANCQVKSGVLYIMPSTADKEDVNVVVNVFGSEFPKTATSAYTCIYGASYAEGQRISSSLVRCRVPKELSLGRHLFNLAPEGSISVIPNFDVRPIHFTVYESCSPAICKGVCVGPLCVCPMGRTGVNCEVIELLPTIDRHFIENQQASTASEGSPYIVVLPTMAGALHRVNSTIDDLHFDASRGIIEWEQPVGSSEPYEITVVSNSLSGESSITWNVTVEPSYTPEVSSVSEVEGGSKMRIAGQIRGIANNLSVPVKLWIKEENDDKPTEVVVHSKGTSFTYDYIPQKSGEFTVVASHPGVSPSSGGKTFTVPSLQLKIEEGAKGPVVHGATVCDATMLRPQNGTVRLDTAGDDFTMVEDVEDWEEETVSLLQCDGKRELWRTYPKSQAPVVTAMPSAITLPMDSTRSRVIEVTVNRNGVYLRPPLRLTHSSDSSQPVFVISTEPNIDQISSSKDYDSIKLTLGQNADYKEYKNTSLQLSANGEVMLRIPVYFVPSSDKLNVNICLKDAYEQQPSNAQETAILSVSNTALGIDDVRSNLRVNKEYVQFTLPEGFYQVTAKAPNYRTVSEIVQISAANTSFCIEMEAIDPRPLIAISEQGVSVMNVKGASTMRFPQIVFTPSSVNRSDNRILVSLNGATPGLISAAPFGNDLFALTPSLRSAPVNSSFWIDINWKEPMTLSNGCNARTISVPFLFLADGSNELQKVSVNLVAVSENADYKQLKICDAAGKPVPMAYSTSVSCDCSQGARTKCRQRYKSAAACGSAWKRISDDTVSLQVLSTYFLLLTDCKSVHVNMTELDEAMQCVSSLESECPIMHRRRRDGLSVRLHTAYMLADGPVDVINHLSQLNGQVAAVLNPMFPVLNALDMQSIRMATLYSDFVQKIQKIFPPNLIDPLTKETIEKFLRAIGDDSELGVGISPSEAEQFEDKELINLWNATVNDWTSGRMDSPSENQGIAYSDVKQLVVAADRLHSLTRQNGASDPFSLLHEYVGQILTTNGSGEEQCLSAAVIIDPVVVYEDGSVTIDVYVQNLQNTTLTNIDLSIDFLRNDVYGPRINFGVGPSWSAGINTMSGFGVLSPQSPFEMHWTRKIIAENRLTASAFYQAVIVLGFHKDGVPSKQRLKSPLIEIRPRRSIRVLHFVNGNVTSSSNEPFSAMTAVFNNGYSTLSDVRILHTDIDMQTGSVAAPFDITRMDVDGKQIGPTLSPTLGEIKSGTSKRITYHMTTPGQEARIVNMSAVLADEGQLMRVEDEHTYSVKAAASAKGGFIVSPIENSEPVFFYRPDHGSIVNVVPLQFSNTQTRSADENSKKTTILASFKNSLSPAFTGALWGTFKLPPIPDNYRLTSVVDLRGKRTRTVMPVAWIEEKDGDKVLNFIDSGAAFPVSDITYELELAEPKTEAGPDFDQTSYRVQVFPESWPQPGYPVAAISADAPQSSQLTYSLYTPNNEKAIAVDPQTGELFVTSSLPPGDEFCTLLVAKDQLGQERSVPVAINTGGPRRECVNFDTTGLSSSTYHGPHRGSVGPWFPLGPPTSTPGGPFTTYTAEPELPPSTPRSPWETESPAPDDTTTAATTTRTTVTTTSRATETSGEASTDVTVTEESSLPYTTPPSSDTETTVTTRTYVTFPREPFPLPSETVSPESQNTGASLSPTEEIIHTITPESGVLPEANEITSTTGSAEEAETTLAVIMPDPIIPTITPESGVLPDANEYTSTTGSAEEAETTLAVIMPDPSPETLPPSLETVTESAPPLITVTPDSHPSPMTRPTSIVTSDNFPIPLLPLNTKTLPGSLTTLQPSSPEATLEPTTEEEFTVSVTPDTSLVTVAAWPTEMATHSITADHTLSSLSSGTEVEVESSDVTTISSELTFPPPMEITTVTSDEYFSTTGYMEGTSTVNPADVTTQADLPPILPPIVIPTGSAYSYGTTTTIVTTKGKTTLDPYYGVACSKRGEPIWDLICELSKASVRKD